jgi:hypothetical protein
MSKENKNPSSEGIFFFIGLHRYNKNPEFDADFISEEKFSQKKLFWRSNFFSMHFF